MNPTSIGGIERRAHPRVAVALRCYSAGGRARTAVARTVNISRTGVLLTWSGAAAAESTPKLGETLRMDVVLPPSKLGQKCLRCSGRVVRVQLAENEEPLIALEIAQMEFREHKPAAVRVAGGSMRAAGGIC